MASQNDKTTLVVVTGASKGFGRAVVLELASYQAFHPLHLVR